MRVSISNYETMLGNAFKRSLRQKEPTSPRISDLPAIVASTTGKIELESVEEGRESKVVDDLIKKAARNIFRRYFDAREFDGLVSKFEEGLVFESGSSISSSKYSEKLPQMDDLAEIIRRVEPSDEPAAVASAIEFVLEGLHLNRRINREQVAGGYRYRR